MLETFIVRVRINIAQYLALDSINATVRISLKVSVNVEPLL